MKFKIIILSFALFCVCQNTTAQLSRADIFTADELIFYGLDFSEARFIGSLGFSDPFDIKRRYFPGWNQLLVNERDKYDIGGAYRKIEVDYDFSVVTERNKKVDDEIMVIDEEYQIAEESLADIIKDYKGVLLEGLGLVFIVESFNKNTDYGTFWVTFFDISTNKILMARRMRGKTRGFGLKNYWARTVFNVLNDSKREFKHWKKE